MKLTSIELEAVAEALVGGLPRASGTWIRANCPLCLERTGKEDTRLSLGLNTATAGFVCHRCQVSGRLPAHLHEAGGRTIDLLAEVEANRTASEKPSAPVQAADGYIPLYEGPDAESEVLAPFRRYLEETPTRRLDPAILRRARIGAALSGYLRGRVIVPHFDAARRWLGWVARDVTGTAQRKYLYPKGMKRDRLWNEVALGLETAEPVLLVEGVFDALPYGEGAAAFLGKPTAAHLPALVAARRPLVVALDGDAWAEAWALAIRLRLRGARAAALRLPPGEDPGSLAAAHGATWLQAKARETIDALPKI